MKRTGSCLCGSATFEAKTLPTMQACHCSCRKWGSGPFMAVPCKAASFAGSVARYASSEGVERGFCATCGSNLFYHAAGEPIHAIPIAFFDDKPDYYEFANATKKMTGAEFEKKFKEK